MTRSEAYLAFHYFVQVLWNPEDDKTETQQEIYEEYEACEVQLQERMASRACAQGIQLPFLWFAYLVRCQGVEMRHLQGKRHLCATCRLHLGIQDCFYSLVLEDGMAYQSSCMVGRHCDYY